VNGVRPLDTDPEAHRAQLAVYARMRPARRVELAFSMSDLAREVAADGIRSRHPEYDEAFVRHALLRMLLGDALFRAAWPSAPLLEP
jgi:hypothetical protein